MIFKSVSGYGVMLPRPSRGGGATGFGLDAEGVYDSGIVADHEGDDEIGHDD